MMWEIEERGRATQPDRAVRRSADDAQGAAAGAWVIAGELELRTFAQWPPRDDRDTRLAAKPLSVIRGPEQLVDLIMADLLQPDQIRLQSFEPRAQQLPPSIPRPFTVPDVEREHPDV